MYGTSGDQIVGEAFAKLKAERDQLERERDQLKTKVEELEKTLKDRGLPLVNMLLGAVLGCAVTLVWLAVQSR